VLQALSTPTNRSRTFGILVVAGLLGVAAGAVGLSDNPPGIALAYLATAIGLLGLTHPWRTGTPYKRLFFFGGIGFAAAAFLHNLLYALATMAGELPLLRGGLEALHVVFFLVAILVCPPAFVIGLAGWTILSVRARRTPPPPSTP